MNRGYRNNKRKAKLEVIPGRGQVGLDVLPGKEQVGLDVLPGILQVGLDVLLWTYGVYAGCSV